MDAGPSPASVAGVLRTKLHVPPAPHVHVDRPRLTEDVPTRRLTLLSAPAGFGKSVLAAGWSRQHDAASVWISLDAGDNDPVRFWRHLAAGIDEVDTGAGTPLGPIVDALVTDDAEPMPDVVMTGIVNAMPAAFLLVLDDYHVISDARVHASLRFLLDHGPAGLRTVLTTRADPPLPLARLRARGELTEIRADDLRFRGEEAAAVLQATAGRDLTDATVRALEARTEGWAAGLQLAGMSLASRDEVDGFVAAFSGSNRFVLDFLTEEVLDQQPADVRDFLVTTSALDVLTGPLCDAVTGRDDGQQMLESLERSNLFLVPLDDVRGSWRYHHLFADLLRVRLAQRPAEDVATLHGRAAAWFEQEGMHDEALHHALAGGDVATARRIVEQHVEELLLRREGVTAQRWFEALPDGGAESRRLLLARARMELYRGRLGEAGALLEAVATAHREEDGGPDPLAPMTLLLRAFEAHLRGDADDQVRYAEAVVAALGDGGPSVDSLFADWHLATAAWLRGAVAEAEAGLAANVAAWRRIGLHERAAWAAHTLGRVQLAAGRPDAAIVTYRTVLAEDAAADRPPAAAVAHLGLGEVAHRRDDLPTARTHAEAAIERCHGLVHSEVLAAALGLLARVHAATGDVDEARARFDDAIAHGPQDPVVDLLDPTPARRATQLLRSGDVAAAAAWVGGRELSTHDPSHSREPGLLVLARLRIARGEAAAARSLLDALAAAAARDGRDGDLVEIETVRARCLDATGDEDGAMAVLSRAVTLASAQGAVRPLVDEEGIGPLLGRLVGASTADGPLLSEPVVLQHLRRLTEAFDDSALGVSSQDVDAVPGMVVPLTVREREVLALVAEGLRNQDICDRLFISMNTTKKHVSSVLRKLGVESRTAAVGRARDLGLLGR